MLDSHWSVFPVIELRPEARQGFVRYPLRMPSKRNRLTPTLLLPTIQCLAAAALFGASTPLSKSLLTSPATLPAAAFFREYLDRRTALAAGLVFLGGVLLTAHGASRA
jgi:hypothetical protein